MSDSLQPPGLQHTRFPCPSLTPRTWSNSCPSNWWCHPPIASFVIPFCLQSFPAAGSFPMSQFFASGGQSIRAPALQIFFNNKLLMFWLYLVFAAKAPIYPGSPLTSSEQFLGIVLTDYVLNLSPHFIHQIKYNSQLLGCALFFQSNTMYIVK